MNIFNWLSTLFNKKSEDKLVSNFEQKKLVKLSQKLQLQFNNNLLFAEALTHRSYLEKSTNLCKSNERLEFLGDAVLGVIIAETLFSKFPNEDEGFLTKTRSHIVDKSALFEASKRLGLKQFLFYDGRFINDSEEGIKTILADCTEALIGAIYLDKGIDEAKIFVNKWIATPNLDSGKYQIDNNFKGQLLEYTHTEKLSNPNYIIVSSNGPDHAKEFIVEVQIADEAYGRGKGKNKKSAEQEAAKSTLLTFQK